MTWGIFYWLAGMLVVGVVFPLLWLYAAMWYPLKKLYPEKYPWPHKKP